MEILIGALLALGVGGLSTLVGFDRDRAFYPVVLVVIASYYGLFAVMAGGGALWPEAIGLAAFTAVAVIGFRTSLWLVAAALLAHGVFDLVHPHMIDNPGVPRWWPAFCLAFDAAAAGYLAVRLLQERQRARPA